MNAGIVSYVFSNTSIYAHLSALPCPAAKPALNLLLHEPAALMLSRKDFMLAGTSAAEALMAKRVAKMVEVEARMLDTEALECNLKDRE